MPLHPITPGNLLESVGWSVSEPTSSACIFTEFPEIDDADSVFYDARGDGRDSEASTEPCSRVLRERYSKNLSNFSFVEHLWCC